MFCYKSIMNYCFNGRFQSNHHSEHITQISIETRRRVKKNNKKIRFMHELVCITYLFSCQLFNLLDCLWFQSTVYLFSSGYFCCHKNNFILFRQFFVCFTVFHFSRTSKRWMKSLQEIVVVLSIDLHEIHHKKHNTKNKNLHIYTCPKSASAIYYCRIERSLYYLYT